ncbi:MAG TPA: septum site-determining protein MinD [Clostridiales bacterium]|nr:septum site-determining protein MinD [Clostridiales bacterium]
MARKIVITSGKGGVGKTTIAANLGAYIAKLGKRACVLDADFGLNNLDVVAGVENLVVYDVGDCIAGRCRAKQALIECPSNKNFYVLPSVAGFSAERPSADSLGELIDGLDASFDFIIIDCPAGLGGGFHLAVSVADEAIVVATPQISSLRDADKALSILRSYSLKSVKILVNRVRGDLVADGSCFSPEQIEKTLKTPLVGVIPDDDAMFLDTAGTLPFDSGAHRALKILTRNIVEGRRKIYNCANKYSGFFGSIRRGIKRNI